MAPWSLLAWPIRWTQGLLSDGWMLYVRSGSLHAILRLR